MTGVYTASLQPQPAANVLHEFSVALTPATTTAAGGVARVLNPLGERAIITRVFLDIQTPSTGAATVDAGVAANGTTSADNLLDGLDVNAAAGLFDNLTNPGTNGKRSKVLGATDYITITPSNTVAGLVGQLRVELMRAPIPS